MPLSKLFAYRSDNSGEPDIWGPVGIDGWKVEMRSSITPGPGKSDQKKEGSSGNLSPASCSNASNVFIKAKVKAQKKKAGMLAQVRK